MAKMMLSDDGSMDTVIACRDCGEEFRYNFTPAGEMDDKGWVISRVK